MTIASAIRALISVALFTLALCAHAQTGYCGNNSSTPCPPDKDPSLTVTRTVTVGCVTYFDNPPWILYLQGATTPQPFVFLPWVNPATGRTSLWSGPYVPNNATGVLLSMQFYRALTGGGGYIDAEFTIRINPSYNYTTLARIGVIAAASPGLLYEIGGQTVWVPWSPSTPVYWLIQGSTLYAGTDATVALLAYRTC